MAHSKIGSGLERRALGTTCDERHLIASTTGPLNSSSPAAAAVAASARATRRLATARRGAALHFGAENGTRRDRRVAHVNSLASRRVPNQLAPDTNHTAHRPHTIPPATLSTSALAIYGIRTAKAKLPSRRHKS